MEDNVGHISQISLPHQHGDTIAFVQTLLGIHCVFLVRVDMIIVCVVLLWCLIASTGASSPPQAMRPGLQSTAKLNQLLLLLAHTRPIAPPLNPLIDPLLKRLPLAASLQPILAPGHNLHLAIHHSPHIVLPPGLLPLRPLFQAILGIPQRLHRLGAAHTFDGERGG
jgi:hypothetical protein